MFTGIIEEKGSVSQITQNGSSLVLELNCSFAKELSLGESVAVNGVCLTVTNISDSSFCADVTPETFRRTSLGALSAGSPVNLERAMKADGRFGGHIVSGHIDGTGKLLNSVKEDNAVNVFFSVDEKLGRYIIEKGSVAIDGISLTVASVSKENSRYVFSIAVIPHTWENTTLCKKNTGAVVNIECDVVGKYIEHFLNFKSDAGKNEEKIPEEFYSNFPSYH
ncbi:riboflavin synthase [Treponema sp.]|uniref:riboflavin synthase n=1 Tax=Treponema sp. TaxID=166 RepID=UPI00257AC956|nr:riboflavin synthase [Treponema sp.]MBE6353270.1 riboflavin synthase [Treponema sp.]